MYDRYTCIYYCTVCFGFMVFLALEYYISLSRFLICILHSLFCLIVDVIDRDEVVMLFLLLLPLTRCFIVLTTTILGKWSEVGHVRQQKI